MLNIIFNLIPANLKILVYKLQGKKPWSWGYHTFKFSQIKKAIYNKEIMEKFTNLKSLPLNYGYGLDERIIEYPWLLSRIPEGKGKFLDVGSVLNFKEILEFPFFKNKKITIVNLAPEKNCFWQKEISYVFSDIRNLSFKADYFDCISCLSTLEHIGMDNTIYIKDEKYREKNTSDFKKALSELKRVLKKDGKIFITVPFGKYQNLGRFQQFDSELLKKMIEVFQPAQKQLSFYKYTKDGWNLSTEEDCNDSEYFDIYQNKDFTKGMVAGARAVVCLELIK